jgi:response regulator RpfG family c-di-GMP phosphodiesterase
MKPKILWVDDEPFILSAVKRLLEMNNFEIVTCLNPHDVEGLLRSNVFHILVSDQRMPQMTGVDLLTSIKEKFPLLTRLMVTGFSDKDLLEEAVNRAGVYRFISKPWDEQELLSDLKASYEHHLQKAKNHKLTQEIKTQNKALVELTNNLEGIVLERTREIQRSNVEIETRGKSIRELAYFTEKIHEVGNFKDLINFISKDLRAYFEAASPLLLVETAQKVNNIYFLVKKNVRTSKVEKYFENYSEIRFNDERDRLKLIEIFKETHG